MERGGRLCEVTNCFPEGDGLGSLLTQYFYIARGACLVAQTVMRLPTMRETWVRSLGQEDPLEEEMAPHSSTLAWKIP